jgi:hypothetical protein
VVVRPAARRFCPGSPVSAAPASRQAPIPDARQSQLERTRFMLSPTHMTPDAQTGAENSSLHRLSRLDLIAAVVVGLAVLAFTFGIGWDIQWHKTVGRDRALTPAAPGRPGQHCHRRSHQHHHHPAGYAAGAPRYRWRSPRGDPHVSRLPRAARPGRVWVRVPAGGHRLSARQLLARAVRRGCHAVGAVSRHAGGRHADGGGGRRLRGGRWAAR